MFRQTCAAQPVRRTAIMPPVISAPYVRLWRWRRAIRSVGDRRYVVHKSA
jgi:hypothetical protein